MKKIIASLALMAMLIIALPMTSNAQIGKRRSRSYRARTYAAQTYQRPSFYRRHRNLINVGAATGAGAIIGGIAGGRRGMGIGAVSGAGAGALYTYVLKKKKRRY